MSQRKGQLDLLLLPLPDLGCRCAIAHTAVFVIKIIPSRSPATPSPLPHLFFLLLRSPYSRGPYLACVQSDGMLGKQQSIHGDADAYTVPEQHRWFTPVVPELARFPKNRLRAIEFASPPDYNERNRRYYSIKK